MGATKALVDNREQAVTVPSAQAFLLLFFATDLMSGASSTSATSQKTGIAITKPVAARAAVEFFSPVNFNMVSAICWQAPDFSR